MISLIKTISEIKRYSEDDLKRAGYHYYEEVKDWIDWDRYGVEDYDSGYGTGWMIGKGISGIEYIANCDFQHEGGWTPLYDTISDIEEKEN